jgi:hypothetical protein
MNEPHQHYKVIDIAGNPRDFLANQAEIDAIAESASGVYGGQIVVLAPIGGNGRPPQEDDILAEANSEWGKQ